MLGGVVALALWFGGLRSGWDWSGGGFGRDLGRWAAVLVPLWLGLAWAGGMYDLRRVADRWTAVVLATKVSGQMLLLWAVLYFIPPPWTLVRHVAIAFALGAAVAVPLWRRVYAGVVSRPLFRRRMLIVGAGRAGRALLAAIRSDAPHLVDAVGFCDDDPALAGTLVDGLPVVADRGDLVAAAGRLGVDELVLAITRDAHGELLRALLDAQEQGLQITPLPVLFEAITGRVPVEHIGDHWAVALPLGPLAARGPFRLVKRAFDLGLGIIGLLILAPLLVVVAPLIHLESAGPVFYRQVRVGRGGRLFTLYKLRTMRLDAESEGPVWATPDDPRATRLGRWLRRTRLDELPQAINILAGDMSLVGPRPERPAFVAELAAVIPFYRARHAVRPGLTGWATIHQGYARSTEDALLKLQYDLYYIKHQSLLLDAYILLRTVAAVWRGLTPSRFSARQG